MTSLSITPSMPGTLLLDPADLGNFDQWSRSFGRSGSPRTSAQRPWSPPPFPLAEGLRTRLRGGRARREAGKQHTDRGGRTVPPGGRARAGGARGIRTNPVGRDRHVTLEPVVHGDLGVLIRGVLRTRSRLAYVHLADDGAIGTNISFGTGSPAVRAVPRALAEGGYSGDIVLEVAHAGSNLMPERSLSGRCPPSISPAGWSRDHVAADPPVRTPADSSSRRRGPSSPRRYAPPLPSAPIARRRVDPLSCTTISPERPSCSAR